jgi:hypothetical protein
MIRRDARDPMRKVNLLVAVTSASAACVAFKVEVAPKLSAAEIPGPVSRTDRWNEPSVAAAATGH